MYTSKDNNSKHYCCKNPDCLHVFSEPIVINHYACPQCKKLINLKASSAQPVTTKNPAFNEDQKQETNNPNTLPASNKPKINYLTQKAQEELTLQERLEAMVERSHKEQEKANTPATSEPNCLHYFGYLRKREKKQEIPQECIVCTRAIDCLMSDSEKSKESLREIKKWYSF